jgi:DNA-binding NtrC family response regulator
MVDKKNVLIVDDDKNFRTTLSKILARKGYETAMAENGFRALDLIKENEYDVVLMDIKMPVMDGVETFKKLKAIKPDTVVIMMTAFSVDELIKDALAEGVYAILRKPLEIDTVTNMIEMSQNGCFLAVVDDNPDICNTMKTILERKGYSITTASSGEEAISIARERPVDIFFIDMKLPVLNGLETYLEIKKINPRAVAVMMTAYRQEMGELIQQAIENSAYACLYKPFDMDEAMKIVAEISKRKRRP